MMVGKETEMEEEIQAIFSRQYKRMENALKDVNFPEAGKMVLSQYWKYCEGDVQRKLKGDRNGTERNFNR